MVNKKNKICFVIDNMAIGGANKLTIDVIKLLDINKYEIKFVILEKKKDDFTCYSDIPEYVSVVNLDFFNLSFTDKIYTLDEIFKDYDIIHSCLEVSNFYCSLMNIYMLRKKKFIATIHGIDGVFIEDDYLIKEFKKLSYWKYNICIKYLTSVFLKYYDGYITVCEFLKYFIINKRKLSENKINVVYHGIDLQNWNKYCSEDEIKKKREEYGICNNDFIVGYCGRLSYGKGLEKLIETFSEIVKCNSNIKLMFVGDGERKNYLLEMIKKLYIENNCIIVGFQKNTNVYYNLFDMMVLPSMSEGVSIVILEAMYNKVISLCSNVGGTPEIIKNGANGFLFEKNNFAELKEKIIYTYKNKDILDEIRNNAHYTVVNKFNLRNNIKVISDVIDKILVK